MAQVEISEILMLACLTRYARPLQPVNFVARFRTTSGRSLGQHGMETDGHCSDEVSTPAHRNACWTIGSPWFKPWSW